MKTKKMVKFALCALLICVTTAGVNAQVTVGSQAEPASGALLDLKNLSIVTPGAVSADKGLLFPRVNLTSRTSLYPIVTVNPTDPTIKANHTGLTVYNLNLVAGENLTEGLYIWDGLEWVKPGGTELKAYTLTSNTVVTLESNVNVVYNPNYSDAKVILPTTGVETGRVLYVVCGPNQYTKTFLYKSDGSSPISDNSSYLINAVSYQGSLPTTMVAENQIIMYVYIGGGLWFGMAIPNA
jgi:hypothetical protein